VISHEVFSEKLVSSLSRQPSPVSQSIKIEETIPPPPPEPAPPSPPSVQAEEKTQNEVATKEATIPFIDEEFDELSYVLHRRQFGDKENKVPIKEETIFIKSSLRNSFMQKFATPLRRSFTRKASQKSISKNDSSNNNTNTNTNINNLKFKLEIVSNEKRAQQIETSKINNESTTTTAPEAAPNAVNNQSITLLKSNIIPVPNSSSLANSSSSQTPKISNNNNNTNNNPVLEKQASRQMSNPPPPQTHSFTNNVNNYKNKGKSENRARKALRTISFILGAFIFCFAPWHVVVIVNSFCTNCWQSTIYHHFYYSCYFLCYMNSPINPFMYALANQQFSKTFFRILKGDLRRL